MVTPLVQNSGKGDWAKGGDHTGNTNGNMYLINAGRPSSGPVDLFFSTQVNNLCPGSVYSFSAWLVNVNTTSNTVPICGTPGPSGTIPAKVTFNIKNTSGTILQTFTTPDLPLTANRSVAPNWQQYGFQFTLPSGTTSLVLEMRDALGGLASYCGNDLAIDDILFTACTPTATVSINSAASAAICSGSSATISSTLTNSPFTNPAYQWQKSINGGVSWTNVGTPGTSANNFTISSTASTDGGMYRVLVGPDVSSLSSSTCVTASNSITLTVTSVALHPDVIECNNGVAQFTSTDPTYGVTYGSSGTYNWSVTGGPFNFQGASDASSQYPRIQFQRGYTYTVAVQFTSNGITCNATQMVYKNVTAADTINGSKDTTVCFNTSPISLSGRVSPVTNNLLWYSSGTGSFSTPGSISTTYTPSAADKTAGIIKLYLKGWSTFNANGSCGTDVSYDSMTLRIYPNNTGTNSAQTICSNQVVNYTPVSAIPGSSFSWTSAVTSGNATGNSPTGTGNIIDSLVNISTVTNGVITYTITPYAFTPSNTSCPGTPFTYTVTLRPRPAVNITNNAVAICTGTATNIQFNSSIAGSLYTWNSSVISGTASNNSSNNTPSTTNTINDVLTNGSATSNATVRYRITATSPFSCSRTDSTDVTVYALPTTANAGPD